MKEKPEIEVTKNAFKIILPNINAKYTEGNASVPQEKISERSVVDSKGQVSEEEEKILEYVRSHGVITKNNVIGLLEVSASTATRVLGKMIKNNLLRRNGKAKNTNYTIN